MVKKPQLFFNEKPAKIFMVSGWYFNLFFPWDNSMRHQIVTINLVRRIEEILPKEKLFIFFYRIMVGQNRGKIFFLCITDYKKTLLSPAR